MNHLFFFKHDLCLSTVFQNRNLITMERIILLSFNSTDNDDCGLPYLCSNSGRNETQLIRKVLTPAKVVLKPFSASEAPPRDGRKHGVECSL